MSACGQYETALTDEQWEVLSPLLPAPQWRPGGPGRPPCDRRRVINGIVYVNKTGCQWRMLPKTSGLGRPCMGTSGAGGGRVYGSG